MTREEHPMAPIMFLPHRITIIDSQYWIQSFGNISNDKQLRTINLMPSRKPLLRQRFHSFEKIIKNNSAIKQDTWQRKYSVTGDIGWRTKNRDKIYNAHFVLESQVQFSFKRKQRNKVVEFFARCFLRL